MGRHLAQSLLHFSPTSNFMAWAFKLATAFPHRRNDYLPSVRAAYGRLAFPYVGIQEHLMAAVCEIKSGLWL